MALKEETEVVMVKIVEVEGELALMHVPKLEKFEGTRSAIDVDNFP
ncbi:hypothetical protein Godav_027906 [Gossypium davidsonii]|uniref:Uncharacterized protein n=1 Tax=Gossypium davidsonii TaxID=34287 RepID=A0A7J8RZ09_GOSDV|nr:hypothetical protein [Gossypium davidsonii]